jgi:hypothetical protein
LASNHTQSAGCSDPIPAPSWNAKVSGWNRELARVGLAFRAALKPLERGQAPDLNEVTSAREEVETTLDSIAEEIGKITPPSGTSGDDFYRAYKEFLQEEDSVFREEADKIMDVLQDPSATVATKQAVVQQFSERMKKTEAEALEKLKKKQTAFATENKLVLPSESSGKPAGTLPGDGG